MKLKRKRFCCDSHGYHEISGYKEVVTKNWLGNDVKTEEPEYSWVSPIKELIEKKVSPFVESLGDRFITINEYTVCDGRIGDDNLTKVIVYYWEE